MRLLPSHVLRAVLVIGVLTGGAGAANAQLKKATPEQIEKDIKSVIAGGNARTFATQRLGEYEAPLKDKQAEVSELLMKLVKDSKDYNACRALSVWATETELKALMEYLDTGDISKAAVYVYSKQKYPAASKALAARIEDGAKDYKVLIDAVVNQGADAEEFVIPYLTPKTKKKPLGVSIEILLKIGTKKSLDPLNALMKQHKDGEIIALAKKTVTKIEDREKEKKDK